MHITKKKIVLSQSRRRFISEGGPGVRIPSPPALSQPRTTGKVNITVDPGPTAATGKDTVGHNKTVDLTSLINGLISGNTETLTTVSSASGSAVLSNGTVSYTAPASGPDTLTHTVQDQYADQATGTVNITVDPGPTAATGSADTTGWAGSTGSVAL
jgi:hypothetical protein